MLIRWFPAVALLVLAALAPIATLELFPDARGSWVSLFSFGTWEEARRAACLEPESYRLNSDESDPAETASRERFLREVLFAEASPGTKGFRDRPDSYHVRKLDLLRGLLRVSAEEEIPLHAVVIVGPYGLFWTYSVYAFTGTSDAMRVTVMHVPHARIGWKGEGSVDVSALQVFQRLVARRAGIHRAAPSLEDLRDRVDGLCLDEFGFDFVLASRHAGGVTTHFGDIGSEEGGGQDLIDALNEVASNATATYAPGEE